MTNQISSETLRHIEEGDPNWQLMAAHIQKEAIPKLKQRCYNAAFVGGTWQALSAANVAKDLAGLWFGAHGGCSEKAGLCYVRTLDQDKWRGFYPPNAFRLSLGDKNDWRNLHASSQKGFVQLMGCHCTGMVEDGAIVPQVESKTVREWLAARIGQPAAKVGFCHLENSDAKIPEAYLDSIDRFVGFFPSVCAG